MIILIAGATHTGKTLLAQKLLEKYKIPYLSEDLLKMGLIRSGYTKLTPEDDRELTDFLWPVIREIIKTAIENRPSLIIEGGYIPFDWRNSFEEKYLSEIKYCCLVMSESYIQNNFDSVKEYADAAETRIDDSYCTVENLLKENIYNYRMCLKYGCNHVLIDKNYIKDIEQAASFLI